MEAKNRIDRPSVVHGEVDLDPNPNPYPDSDADTDTDMAITIRGRFHQTVMCSRPISTSLMLDVDSAVPGS